MKFKSVLLSLFFAIITIGLVSCAKTEQDKLISFNEKVYNWLQSPDCMKEIKANKTVDALQKFMTTKSETFAKEAGFKDGKEYQQVAEKLKDDKKVNEAIKKYEEKGKAKYQEIRQYFMELMQLQMQQQAPAQPQETIQEAPAAEPTK